MSGGIAHFYDLVKIQAFEHAARKESEGDESYGGIDISMQECQDLFFVLYT